jgi:N-methylhydantoinase A
MRFAVDTGGTFTDLVIDDGASRLALYKSPTIPSDPVQGILDVFEIAAASRSISSRDLLGSGTVLIHATTRGLNAVLTGSTARTAFLTTEGHPDILVLREGGRTDVFDLRHPYPEPYIPRSMTFEVPERVSASGEIVRPLDEDAVLGLAATLAEREVEAIAVCLLWSIANPSHELRLGELLAEHLPGVPITLSHQLNPCIREYRRASATAIDASLKPIMTEYIARLQSRIEAAGFSGRLLIVTSAGAVLDAEDVAAAPIHSLNSGPSMAPVAGRHYVRLDAASDIAIVADTGGTSYDVSLVRRGRIPWTRETWLGRPYFGHMTGFPSVDVRSVGAGGGSVASVDSGGLLRVGPESAGAVPGPACYEQGGERPTLTDACLLVGLLDPEFFLGGRRKLAVHAAEEAIRKHVARPLGLDEFDAAAAVIRVATERMVSAIEEITIHQGIDPRHAALVGGGGAAGLNAVAIARHLRCPEVIIPSVGAGLSAAGALISDLSRTYEAPLRTTSLDFDFEGVQNVLTALERSAREFIRGPGRDAATTTIEFSVEARYPHQVWELEVPLPSSRIAGASELDALVAGFHAVHREVFAVADEDSPIEFVSWHARARCQLAVAPHEHAVEVATTYVLSEMLTKRPVYLEGRGHVDARVWRLEGMPFDEIQSGPAIIESETTTVFIDPEALVVRRPSGTLHISPFGDDQLADVHRERNEVRG